MTANLIDFIEEMKMKQSRLAVFCIALVLAAPCLADSTPSGESQQRMQPMKAMTQQQRQSAMDSIKSNMQGRMADMKSRMRSRMGGNRFGANASR